MDAAFTNDISFAARGALGQVPDATMSKAAAAKNRAQVREVAEKFEGMFLTQMFGHMFKGLSTDGLMGGGNGEAVFRDLLVQEYGTQVAKAGGIGLADSIERQLLALQEVK